MILFVGPIDEKQIYEDYFVDGKWSFRFETENHRIIKTRMIFKVI